MMKSARKKLKKFWSKKKKKKKTHYIDDAHHHCSRCSYSSYPSYAYPSAPPLPPNWEELGLGYENSSDQDHNTASIHQVEISESNQIEEAAAGADYLISSSYQQYVSSNPVFDLPVSENKVRAAGFFSCVFKQISSPAGKSFTSTKRRTNNRDCLTYLALDSKCEI